MFKNTMSKDVAKISAVFKNTAQGFKIFGIMAPRLFGKGIRMVGNVGTFSSTVTEILTPSGRAQDWFMLKTSSLTKKMKCQGYKLVKLLMSNKKSQVFSKV